MPIWVPIGALAIAWLLVIPVGDYLGLDPVVAVAFSVAMALSAIMVLADGWLLPHLFPAQPHLAAWLAWLVLVAPTALLALAAAGYAIHDSRRAPAAPVGSCRRCGAALFPDHTGHRYVAADTGYLCPPPFQQPGQRRHQLLPAERPHGAGRA